MDDPPYPDRSSLFQSRGETQLEIYVEDHPQPLARFVEVADTFISRAVGLQFRLPLRRGHGLLIYPAAGVHTFWMRGAIDILWISREGEVLRICQRVRPWRLRMAPKGSYAVLELGAGTVEAFGQVNLGSRLSKQHNV
ncbi:MAG: DUF192 domain-containing protein [Pirellulales bacterium]|nr:DUF192 domain-containing protein [Pirellulales bacterium]